MAKAWRKVNALCQFLRLPVTGAVLILSTMALISENPMMSKKKSLGGKMRGRRSPDLDLNSQSANDNSPSRAVAGEGVVQCLHFLARELDNLAFPASAADVLSAAYALQAAIDASRHTAAAGHAAPDRAITISALAPTA